MARKDALLRLQKSLLRQRDELKKKLAVQMEVVGEQCGPGDVADQSLVDIDQELGSQLAALESRELIRVEKAIEALKNGTYGTCEYCEKQIPMTRLKALPHTSCCVTCQREHEDAGTRSESHDNWESAWRHQAIESDRELTVRDVKMESR